jgi:hypothetical protein
VIQPNNCAVRQHTADGVSVGRCWHWLGEGAYKVCPIHGDVTDVQLRYGADGTLTDDQALLEEKGKRQ